MPNGTYRNSWVLLTFDVINSNNLGIFGTCDESQVSKGGRRSDLMVNVLDSGASSWGSSPGLFLGKTLSQCLFPIRCINVLCLTLNNDATPRIKWPTEL